MASSAFFANNHSTSTICARVSPQVYMPRDNKFLFCWIAQAMALKPDMHSMPLKHKNYLTVGCCALAVARNKAGFSPSSRKPSASHSIHTFPTLVFCSRALKISHIGCIITVIFDEQVKSRGIEGKYVSLIIAWSIIESTVMQSVSSWTKCDTSVLERTTRK